MEREERKQEQNFSKIVLIIAFVLILAISVGYAALSTTLQINGRANVSSNSWLVYFTNVQVTTGSVSAVTAPTTSGTTTTTLTWEANLAMPGDFYEFTVDVKNGGTINAMIGTLVNNPLTTAQQAYLTYSVKYATTGGTIERYDKLNVNETVPLRIRVEYKTDLNPSDLPTSNQSITLTYSSQYVQADSNAKDRN